MYHSGTEPDNLQKYFWNEKGSGEGKSIFYYATKGNNLISIATYHPLSIILLKTVRGESETIKHERQTEKQ